MAISIKRALISVSDKTNVLDLALFLVKNNVEIISTGGTFEFLINHNLPVRNIFDVTGFPEILDGRVKTLHPKIHGGILSLRNFSHVEEQNLHQIENIDLVCVNLYPFADVVANNVTQEEAIENIDIGGVTLIRASAKNYLNVVLLTNSRQYKTFIDNAFKDHQGILFDTKLSMKFAYEGFQLTAFYDSLISNYFDKELLKNDTHFEANKVLPLELLQILRYGENPHQQAAFYKEIGNINGLFASYQQLQGKALSYNNISDANVAWECVQEFKDPCAVIVKHANPCGIALGNDAYDAYLKSIQSDPISSFGGIIAFNESVDHILAEEIIKNFYEIVIAPNFLPTSLKIFLKKPNLRILKINKYEVPTTLEYKSIGGGMLVQSIDNKKLNVSNLLDVNANQVSPQKLSDLLFAWNIVKYIKSNAIVIVKNRQTLGIGAGQMSRIDATNIAINKALALGFDLKDAVCASDAFFPFRDSIDVLAKHGINGIIQPGGSIKDHEVIEACNEKNIQMVLTGYRVFKH